MNMNNSDNENIFKEIVTIGPRASGKTTRLADAYIQKLYENQGEWVKIVDHYPSKNADRMLIKIILRRIYNEHAHDNIEIDKLNGRLKIVNSKRNLVLHKLDKLINKYMFYNFNACRRCTK